MKACLFLILFAQVAFLVSGFVSSASRARSLQPRVKPVHENFFLDIAGDPKASTPAELYGEVAYKTFVAKNNPDGLLVAQYKIIERARELKLLSLVAESGLLEALEAKGLTLSRLEKLLPLADQLNLLPFALKNKDLVLGLAPLIIEPAPILLPLLTKLLKVPASTFFYPGLALEVFGAFETFEGSFVGILAILLGLPAVALGSVLNTLDFGALAASAPSASSVLAAAIPAAASSNRPVAAKKVSAPVVVAAKKADAPVVSKKIEIPFFAAVTPKTVAPKAAAPRVVVPAAAGVTKRRAVVKVK